MANELLLKLEGIAGESTLKGHEHEIELLTFGWQVGNLNHINAREGAGKPTFQDIRVTKKIDAASAQLFRHCCTGQLTPRATIFVQQVGAPNSYMELLLTEVFVTLYEQGLSTSATVETIALGYRAIEIKYKNQDATGATQTAGASGWDISKNEAT